jgi:anti-sigma B factor antagonist
MTGLTSKLTIAEQSVEDVTVLTLTGEVTLDDGDLAFRKKIHELIDRGQKKIVVDLGGVTYIDSSGVGMMAAKLKTVRDAGGALKVVHLTSRSQRLFGMLKILTAFETFPDVESAVRSFTWRPGG